ncbi:MAG: AraC family transcriptional regulator ligand-binding domain-containing protein [Pseudomonadota bacterium]
MATTKRTLRAKRSGAFHNVEIMSFLVAYALAQGMEMAEIEHATGLREDELGDPNARLPDDLPPKLWLALLDRNQEAVALTVEAARAAPLSILCGLAHGAQYASTLRDVLTFIVEHREILADRLMIELREVGDAAMLVASHPNDHMDSGCTSEVGLGVTARMIHEIMQPRIRPKQIDLRFPPKGPVSDYSDFFGVPVAFEQAETAMVFHRAALETPVERANPRLFEAVRRHFELARSRLELRPETSGLSRLRHAINESAARGDYRTSTIINLARISKRTAQRIAAENETTLKSMIEEVRLDNAKAFLSDLQISAETVSSLVGYSDDRAFRRAFKRLTGLSPSQFRKNLRDF